MENKIKSVNSPKFFLCDGIIFYNQGYSGWKEGIRPALFPMSLILILFCLMLFLTVEWHRMN